MIELYGTLMSAKIIDRLSNYSDELLLDELRRVAKQLGRDQLSIQDIEDQSRCSYETLKRRFGGLRKALRIAGLEVRNFERYLGDEELLAELVRIWDIVLAQEGRRPFKTDLYKFGSRFSEGPYYRRWGSWIKACEAALEWEGNRGRSSAPTAGSRDGGSNVKRLDGYSKRAIPLRIRYEILKRDNFICQTCGMSPATVPGTTLHVDYILPESKGGKLELNNLRCLCDACNLGKGNSLG